MKKNKDHAKVGVIGGSGLYSSDAIKNPRELTIKTPFGEKKDILGGSGVYSSVAASFFTNIELIGPIGNDFPIAQARANGQKIIADVDDSPWSHEDLFNTELAGTEDHYLDWIEQCDGWLCSTKYLCQELRDHGFPADRVWYAPNLYDPTALNAEPKARGVPKFSAAAPRSKPCQTSRHW